MRLSEMDKSNIRSNILDDLYKKSFESFDKRQSSIAKDALAYALEPHHTHIQALPAGLVPKVNNARVRVKYKSPVEVDPDHDIVDEVWSYCFSSPQVGFVATTSFDYGRIEAAPVSLDSRQYAEAAELLDELIATRSEKAKLNKYLRETMSTFSGSLQLKKVWPTTLHKYLPPEPVKTPKAATANPVKKEAPAPVVAPIDLKARLTTNLLEDS